MRTWKASVYGTQRSVHRSENHSFPRPHPKMILASPLQNHKYLLSMHPFYSHFCTFAFTVPLSSIYPVSIVFPPYLSHIPLFSLALFRIFSPKDRSYSPTKGRGKGGPISQLMHLSVGIWIRHRPLELIWGPFWTNFTGTFLKFYFSLYRSFLPFF
jgi:hypothetical protein